jgi:hypothetical protein
MHRLVAMATATTLALGMSTSTLPSTATAGPGEIPEVPEADVGAEADVESGSETKAAILPLVVTGDTMPTADRDRLAGRLVEGLRRGDFDVVEPAEVVAASSGAASCREPKCYTEIATATGASHLVVAVVKVEDRDYQVEVLLVDGKDGSQVASASDSCQICGVAEVGDLLDTAAATLRTKLDNLAQGPARLAVTSTPKGAEVAIDGELKGTTPFADEVPAGEHMVRISLDGYITVERQVNFIEGIEDTQSFELEKVPSRLPARPWGWVSLGVGGAGLTAAIAFTVLANRPYEVGDACKTPDADGDCPDLWNTEPIVLGTAVVGAALTTLGVAILLNSAGRRGKAGRKAKSEAGEETAQRRRFHVGVGLGSVGMHGRF